MLSVLLQSRPWQADRASLVVEKEGNPWTLQCTSQKALDVNPGMIGLCQISCSCPSSALLGPCWCAWALALGQRSVGLDPCKLPRSREEMAPVEARPPLFEEQGRASLPLANSLQQSARHGTLVARTDVLQAESVVLMPTRVHSTEDPAAPAPAAPTPVRTSSLVCEVPLRVTPAQERILVTRLEAARQVYNACLGEARTRVRLVRESKAFQRARTLSRADPARKMLFARARQQHAFSNYALHAYVQALGQSWLGEHLDSLTLQKLASRAYGAANRLLVGKAHRVRFKGKHQLDTVEGKTNSSGIRWCQDHVEWKGLMLPARIDPRDPVLAHGLACPVKYVRLVRRKLGLRNRFYAQLGCEGMPYRKPQHILGTGVVGLDLGPSTIAVVAQQAALREPFCPEVAPEAQALRRLERQLDRQRRANNLANYDDKGRVKHGKKRWHVSKRQRKVHTRRRAPAPQARAAAQAQPWPAGRSSAGAGRHLPAGAALLSGLATHLRALGPSVCAGDVCRAVVSPGCECWRDDRRDQSLAGQGEPNVPL